MSDRHERSDLIAAKRVVVKIGSRLLAESPGEARFLYNLACSEAQLGRKEEALDHLRQAIEINPHMRETAPIDADLDPIRDEPEFSAITGQVGSAGSSS